MSRAAGPGSTPVQSPSEDEGPAGPAAGSALETYDYEDFGDLSGAVWTDAKAQQAEAELAPPGGGRRKPSPMPPPPDGVQVSTPNETYDEDDYADMGGAAAAPGDTSWMQGSEGAPSATAGTDALADETEALLRSLKAAKAKK